MEQKDEEKMVMELFREKFPGFPKGRLRSSESPDFILNIGRHRKIGIELSRLVNHSDSITENIQTSILKKKEKITLYQKKWLNEIWLLLYSDTLNVSPEGGFIDLKISNEPVLFQRVFLFDLFSKRIFKIEI